MRSSAPLVQLKHIEPIEPPDFLRQRGSEGLISVPILIQINEFGENSQRRIRQQSVPRTGAGCVNIHLHTLLTSTNARLGAQYSESGMSRADLVSCGEQEHCKRGSATAKHSGLYCVSFAFNGSSVFRVRRGAFSRRGEVGK